MNKPNYFLISVSNRENLELCKKFALAGFTNSINGAWAYVEINEGDFVSFLYGARAHNLYRVKKKEAIRDAKDLPPWKPITFKPSNRTYWFPFRLYLEPVRQFEELLIRNEFAYVAENLLLRGGYRKTHFQADQTTLQYVSQVGRTIKENVETLEMPKYETFKPKFCLRRENENPPEVFSFKEVILQALIKKY